MAPYASVLVATHRGADVIGGLLDSLEEQTASPQVIVVDNASEDGTREQLAARGGIEVVRSVENLGFSRAMNLAARRAEGEVLVFVNDDCTLDPGFVESLAGRIDTRSGEVMAAGVLRDVADEDLIDTAGIELDPTLLVFDHLNGEPLSVLDGPTVDPVGPSGAAAAFDRDAFLDAGGFDEALFAYWEDVDLVLRLRLAGGTCVLAPDARGTHRHSATLGSGSSRKNELVGFGRGYTLRKWGVMSATRAPRVLIRDGLICIGQAAVDRNLTGLRGRFRGWGQSHERHEYPAAALAGVSGPSSLTTLRRRWRRRRRLRQRA